MSRRLLIAAIPLLAFAGFAALSFWGLERDNPRELTSALLGKPAPNFALPGLDGGPGLATADLATGKPVLVNIFASWCGPCQLEHPHLTALARDEGATILAIAYKDDPNATAAFLKRLGNPYARIGVDRNGRAGIDWGIAGVPETFIVNGKGVVVHRQWGPITTDAQRKRLARMLKETR